MGFPTFESDGGIPIIVYTTSGGGARPIHGAYYADKKFGWMPITWSAEGYFLKHPTSLNITKAISEGKVKKEEGNKPSPEVKETSLRDGIYSCYC